jgi:hypothetical protein
MTESARSTGTVPQRWAIRHQSIGAVDAILLGDTPDDEYRIGITVTGMGDDAPEVDAILVYPCGECGWRMACGTNGEDCHV